MSRKKNISVHNKSDKPDNIVTKENEIIEQCLKIESQLPPFMKDFFLYLKNGVALTTRLAYSEDVLFFCKYLVSHTELTDADHTTLIKIETFQQMTAKDINRYLGDFCSRYSIEKEESIKIMENHNRALARKKSSLAVLFKFLYRDGLIKQNISDGLNPIRLPKPQPDAIKRLEIDEVARMIDCVDLGEAFTEKEKTYWQKTKLRDKAILMLFLTYGLRLSELEQLNISSFNFNRGEFKIYRKRGKETAMPINRTCETVIKEYMANERPQSSALDEEHKDALFLSLQRKRMTTRAIRNMVKKYTALVLDTTAKNGYSPHKLRATAATSLIQQGFSIYDVQNLLDHDDVTTTQLYAAHKKDVKRQIVKNFEWLD
ncbi:phage integrase family protein [Alkaliphilus metalliredigens QYMF]|uniref:Phage integrase family protein n=1 Tax=Alkaliphilus metalliredigens (strain QYMF) TaxID=293826 RepID=A6TR69_ALKMQ|nr:tyrosine-type recombinase/integrase [Alkaliphilus metalliredigens]ABR48687.1 phage integrase family protein [Alkaliphilus metalliredigens QYMF]